jgi:catechol 2,3-dioxygenase-like lactoylglutathione lyase family enzyme
MSSRAKRGTCFSLIQYTTSVLAVLFLAALLLYKASASASGPSRPRILGIADVTIFVSDVPQARDFYRNIINPGHACDCCEDIPAPFFSLPSTQRIVLDQAPASSPSSLLAEVAFRTDDLGELGKFLKAKKINFEEIKSRATDRGYGTRRVLVRDPEGHLISFVGGPGILEPKLIRTDVIDRALIHAGFVVHDRAAEDKFYKDVLGFHVYWHGGMKDGEDNWVDMQVPDGTDWIEYMLKVPENATHKQRGVMNHIALGVPDIHAAQQQLIKNGWKGTEEPKIGRDGKWQLNLYDPDETRVELMEFKPTKEPCCSPYTGPHPHP